MLALKVEHSWEYIQRQPEWLRTLITTLAGRVREQDRGMIASAAAR